jgi:hypothetical protein
MRGGLRFARPGASSGSISGVENPTKQFLTPTEKLQALAARLRAPCFSFVDPRSRRDLVAETLT